MQKKLSHHKTHNINKEWRNGRGTDRLMQTEHTCTFCLAACVDKEGLGISWEKR